MTQAKINNNNKIKYHTKKFENIYKNKKLIETKLLKMRSTRLENIIKFIISLKIKNKNTNKYLV